MSEYVMTRVCPNCKSSVSFTKSDYESTTDDEKFPFINMVNTYRVDLVLCDKCKMYFEVQRTLIKTVRDGKVVPPRRYLSHSSPA